MPVLSKLKDNAKDRPLPHVRRYKIKHLKVEDESREHDPNAWKDRGHTLTIISPPRSHKLDKTGDDLYVNHVHIHPDNWKWLHKPHELTWKQSTESEHSAGHIGMYDDQYEADGGIVRFAQSSPFESVKLEPLKTTYSLDVSLNAGATIQNSEKLIWNTQSKAWAQAKWITGAFKYSFWLTEDGGTINNEFTDVAKNISWSPNFGNSEDEFDSPPNYENTDSSTAFIDENNILSFSSDEPPPTTSDLFPGVMSFQLDIVGDEISGGAMVQNPDDSKPKIYALRGKEDISFAVGSYSLINQDTNQLGNKKLLTHGSKLIVDGGAIPSSTVSQNRLEWTSLTPSQQKKSELPESGHVEFSPNGHFIVGSSFNVKGFRDYSSPSDAASYSEVYLAADKGSKLDVHDLLNMDPVSDNKEKHPYNKAQHLSMEDFYSILKYYLPNDDLHNFIGPVRPDIGDLEEIAGIGNKETEKFYSSLAVPYLVSTLRSSASEDSIKKLNARRAEKYLTNGVTSSPVYQEQTKALYKYHWQLMFRDMKLFIQDQENPTPEQHAEIDKEAEIWRRGLAAMVGENKEKVAEANDLVTNAVKLAKNKKYWAFMAFRNVTRVSSLRIMKFQYVRNNATKIVANNQRFDSIFRILDESGEFAKLFQRAMAMISLANVLPQLKAFGNDKHFAQYSIEIMREFVSKYATSTNPNIMKLVSETKEADRKGHLLLMTKLFVAEANRSGGKWAWLNLVSRFSKKARFAGVILSGVVDAMASIGALSTIFCLASGSLDWGDMSTSQKVGFVTSCVGMLATVVKIGCKATAIFKTYSLGDAFRVMFGREINGTVKIATGIRKWMLGTPKVFKPIGTMTMTSAESVEATNSCLVYEEGFAEPLNEFGELTPIPDSKLSLFFGKNIDEFMATRVAAVMSAVGIGMGLYGSIIAKNPMDRAANILFTISSTIDCSLAIGQSLAEAGVVATSEIGVVSVIGIAAPVISIVAAVAGLILTLVSIFDASTPPDPVNEFVKSSRVLNAGFYMEHETAVDYFQASAEEDDGWVSIQVDGNYLSVSDDGNKVSLASELDYSRSTLFTVYTDYEGNSKIITKVMKKQNDGSKRLTLGALTLTDDFGLQILTRPIDDKKKKEQQLWIIDCQGDVKRDKKEHLLAASFTLENKHNAGHFLNPSQGLSSVKTGSDHTKWTLTKEFEMRPVGLTVPDIDTVPDSTSASSLPSLEQGGTSINLKWEVSPPLPDFFTMNPKNGYIEKKQEASKSFGSHEYTMTVTNTAIPTHPRASTKFKVTIEELK